MTKQPSKTLEELEAQLAAALERYESANQIALRAERDKTAAISEVNEAQRALDEKIAKLRKGAPWNTDWWNAEKRQRAAK